MSYARMMMIYPGESSSVSQEEGALRGRPRLRWEDGVKDDAAKLACRNWRVVALNREGWRKLLKEAEAHPRL
jgi:hypothetical protein